MLWLPIHAIRILLLMAGNLVRRLRRPPGYVSFRLEVEYSEYRQPAGHLILRRLRPPRPSLQDLADQFRRVAGDPRVQGVVLHLRPLTMPSAALESLRELILELRQAGKRVIAWATYYVGSSFYVACAADKILMQPGGTIEPLGLAITYPFLAEALERVGVQGDFIPISPYKSAGDIFSRRDMSDEVRAMTNWMMDSVFEERLRAIAASRGLDEQAARSLVDRTPCTDLQALELGAVDSLVSEEELPGHLGEGGAPARLDSWESARRSLLRRSPPRPGKHVALIAIEGTILDGESGRPPFRPPFRIPILLEPRAGDLTVVQMVRQAMRDRRAAAVVVYVNSGGGSATASEAMRAVLEKAASHKPLVVSMGPIAASGGYWVSTPGRTILAQPSTVTGSIGVIMGKLVTGALLDRLSFGRETISRGKFSRIHGAEAPFDEKERGIIMDAVRRIYDLFLERVSSSRDLDIEQVDAIAGGRVWTGRQALEHGLVDELGGLERALAKARELGGLDPRAPVRLLTAGRRVLAPAPDSTAIAYAMEGLRLFRRARPMCLCPISIEEDGVWPTL